MLTHFQGLRRILQRSVTFGLSLLANDHQSTGTQENSKQGPTGPLNYIYWIWISMFVVNIY